MSEKSWVLYVEGQAVLVSEDVYNEYYRMARRERYLIERDVAIGLIGYAAFDTPKLTGEELLPDRDSDEVVDIIVLRSLAELLHEHLATLSLDEQAVMKLIYFGNNRTGMTQREVASILGISQPAVKKRHDKSIAKLRLLMKVS